MSLEQTGRQRPWSPGPVLDPVPAPCAETLAALPRRLNQAAVNGLVDALVDRIEAYYVDQGLSVPGAAEGYQALQHLPQLRRDFWLAVDYTYDQVEEALAVLARLQAHDQRGLENHPQLAIAMAVVFDSPDAIATSRRFTIWGIEPSQWKPLPDMLEIWDFYTSEAFRRQALMPVEQLIWPLWVHMVDIDLIASEREWVASRFARHRQLTDTYAMVPYDREKLARRTPLLASRSYNMRNLLQYGGVCGDQAHFCTRVYKVRGMPAFKVRGDGRHGGNGHAWAGFLEIQRRQARFAFIGRYDYDFYYTGDVFNPQTRSIVLDRHLAMDLDGALMGFSAYVEARALARIARSLLTTHPDMAKTLTIQALQTNHFCADAWRLLVPLFATDQLSHQDMNRWLGQMLSLLQEHPDITLEILDGILDHVPLTDLRLRQGMYQRVYALYDERPDLQIRLRLRQCRELYSADQSDQATHLAVETLNANPREGAILLPLMTMVVEDAVERSPAQRQSLRRALQPMIQGFPRTRGSRPSQAWEELQTILAKL
ncbi:MAG: hypothetical protein EA401_00880 [Planctomycetota bacterium]|nr:MAG: hypothetical protein EA401_00880 [Planctomycetota bacterium]